MKYQICNAEKRDHFSLIEVWEQSVRATHDFLPEKEIIELRPKILEVYFDAVFIKCYKNKDNTILGFIGISNNKIEMLFISPQAQGQGIGSALCNDAIDNHAIDKVDVNEQNQRAKIFYEKLGFKVIGRSELDEQGKPYPILHMKK